MERGRYYKSYKEARANVGSFNPDKLPSIHISGSVRGMRKLFWVISAML